jgi:hypothetical protein
LNWHTVGVIPALREPFNASWTLEQYDALIARLRERTGGDVEFHVSETPCFFPSALIGQLTDIGRELIRQSMSGEAADAARRVVPDRFRGADRTEPHPTFLQVDVGLMRNAKGDLEPRLVELQAFPSLYGFQIALAEGYRQAFNLPAGLTSFLGGYSLDSYRALVRNAIVGPHDPAEVVLMEIDPHHQKTRPDFVMTEELWGVRAIDIGDVTREGRGLWYRRDGKRTPIKRVYNRVIPDELVRKGLTIPFDYRDDLDVEWTGHPEWFFRVSKFSIPWLRHPSVPRTWFLHQVDQLPAPRENLLLKPLFSFAGGGIIFAPSDEQLAAIPQDRRDQYILQERIAFEPIIDTPHGKTQAEIRLMYVWTDQLRAVLLLLRMGRGKMMGVDHNKGMRWVGASAGFLAP